MERPLGALPTLPSLSTLTRALSNLLAYSLSSPYHLALLFTLGASFPILSLLSLAVSLILIQYWFFSHSLIALAPSFLLRSFYFG